MEGSLIVTGVGIDIVPVNIQCGMISIPTPMKNDEYTRLRTLLKEIEKIAEGVLGGTVGVPRLWYSIEAKCAKST